jgi:putative ABC transport system permease protein
VTETAAKEHVMELGPIFRALVYNRARFWLVALEVALTLAIIVNCVNLVISLRHKYLQPSGIDEKNIVVIGLEPFAPAYQDDSYLHAARERDLERLRAYPGVQAATAIDAVPLSGGGSATGRKAEGFKGDSITAPYFDVSDGALAALGVKLIAGRDFQPGEYHKWEDAAGDVHDQPVILSETLAKKLFPDGSALGKRITNGGDAKSSNLVVGILEHMHNSWPNAEKVEDCTMLLPGQPEYKRNIVYMVRAQPGARDGLVKSLDDFMAKIDSGRIVHVLTLETIKMRTYGDQLALIKILSTVVVLLVGVTALGIVGLTSFSVAQRRRQIGTRRALGATRQDILRYFLLENWLVTGVGLVLGLGLAWGLNFWLAKVAQAPKLDWTLLGGGMLLLWLSGILAALAPALRAMRVAPVVATRTV